MAQWFQRWVKSGNGTKAAMQVYNCKNENVAAAIASRNVRKLKIDTSLQAWIERLGYTDRKAAVNLIAGTKANKIHTSHTEPDKEVPDWQARAKFNEMLLKLKNSFPKDENQGDKNLYLTQIIYEN